MIFMMDESPSRKLHPWMWPAILTVSAAGLRLALIPTRLLLENDGPYYAALAAQLLRGEPSGALNEYWSQLYPVLIAIVGLFAGDLEFAARLVSALCGAALVPAVWLLANEIADPLSADLAALAVLFQPWLLVFSVLGLTEMTFTFLMVIALTFILRAARFGGFQHFAVAGAVTGLAILTRSEGVLLVVGLLAAGLARLICGPGGRALRETGAALAMLLLVMAPQSIGTYRIYDHFNSSWKSSVGLVVGEASDDPAEAERVIYSLDPQGERALNAQANQVSLGTYWLERPGQAMARVQQNLKVVWGDDMFEVWMPAPGTSKAWAIALALLAAYGLTAGSDRLKRHGMFGILAFAAAYALGLASVLVHPRLLVPLVPFALIFLAMGCSGVVRAGERIALRWIPADWRRAGLWLVFLAAASAACLMAFASYEWVRAGRDPFYAEPLAQKQAGLWLRAHAPQRANLLSHNPQILFYFYEGWPFERTRALPWASPQAVLDYARAQNVGYIIMEEWVISAAHFPTESWLDTTRLHPGLRLLMVFGTAPQRVIIYQLTDEVTLSGASIPGACHSR
jgi:4-amino-4-deoxy-L-arabinose transferase-like glycosyltransferase